MSETLEVYECAVHREEAGELANDLIETLATKALPGARLGTGLTALVLAINRLVERMPVESRWKTREVVIAMILERFTR